VSSISATVQRAQELLARAQATLPGQVVQRFSDEHMTTWAAALAYHAFFALFPLLLTVLTVVGLVLRDPVRLEQVAQSLVQLLPGDAVQPVLTVLYSSSENVGLLGLISLAGLIYGASALFGTLEEAFDTLYDRPTRDFIWQKLMSFGMLALVTVLLLLSLLAVSVGEMLSNLLHNLNLPWPVPDDWIGVFLAAGQAVQTGVQALSLGWAFLLFLLIYWIVPNYPLHPRQVWAGALLAALLFRLSTGLFPLYLQYFANVNRYGAAFALALLLLTWLFILAQIVLLGATLNAVLARRVGTSPTQRQTPVPFQSVWERIRLGRRADSRAGETR
jgi:membrane protein